MGLLLLRLPHFFQWSSGIRLAADAVDVRVLKELDPDVPEHARFERFHPLGLALVRIAEKIDLGKEKLASVLAISNPMCPGLKKVTVSIKYFSSVCGCIQILNFLSVIFLKKEFNRKLQTPIGSEIWFFCISV